MLKHRSLATDWTLPNAGKGKVRQAVDDSIALDEDTVLEHLAEELSTLSHASSTSLCYSEFEDISEQINSAGPSVTFSEVSLCNT